MKGERRETVVLVEESAESLVEEWGDHGFSAILGKQATRDMAVLEMVVSAVALGKGLPKAHWKQCFRQHPSWTPSWPPS